MRVRNPVYGKNASRQEAGLRKQLPNEKPAARGQTCPLLRPFRV